MSSAISGHGANRIALPVENIESLAPRVNIAAAEEERLSPAQEGVRLGAPRLRDNESDGEYEIAAIEAGEGEDFLEYPDEYDFSDEMRDEPLSPDDVVITIAGAKPPTIASLNSSPLAAPIPDPPSAMLQKTPLGDVPRIAADGRKAMHVYAHKFSAKKDEPKIAIVVGGLGLNTALTERAIDDLPPEVSLAFAPYAKNLDFWTRKARQAGHEILIELPMEGYGGNQQALGGAALLSSRTEKENLQRLDWLLSRFGGYFGATNYLGAKFTTNEDAMAPILAKLRDAGVAYIDDTGAARMAGDKTGVSMTTVNRVIPPAADETARDKVKRELLALEKIAARDGVALGKTYAYETSIDEISKWARELKSKGIAPAPASAVLQLRGGAG
ncbi:MAG: divergent polysaccharide deacetylase family protein [Marinicaulis sp.]|nr:divergent polysaccharide deacetylase family protein [Marinicaulis sp.]